MPLRDLFPELNPPPPPSGNNPPLTKYQILVGLRPESANSNAHYAVIVRDPTADPSEDCTWYTTEGTEWTETDAYRRTSIPDRAFMDMTFSIRFPVGIMSRQDGQGKDSMWELEKAFRSTPPQPSEFFVARFLRKLVKRKILKDKDVRMFEEGVGPCPEGLEDDPEYYKKHGSPVLRPSPGGSPVMFEMEL